LGRAVFRAQRSVKRSGMMRCRPGTVRNGPGSAVHRFAALALHRIRDTLQPAKREKIKP
jgi:hypothetical protein